MDVAEQIEFRLFTFHLHFLHFSSAKDRKGQSLDRDDGALLRSLQCWTSFCAKRALVGHSFLACSFDTGHGMLPGLFRLPLGHHQHHRTRKKVVFFTTSISSPPATAPASVLLLSNVFARPDQSAAGLRTATLLNLLQNCDRIDGSKIHYGVPKSKIDTQTNQLGVKFHTVLPNRSDLIQNVLSQVGEPLVVVFDRFFMEEIFSFHIHNLVPDALLVLDMQDMHSLRWARQRAVKNDGKESSLSVFASTTLPDSNDDNLIRELASIHRADLTLVCSQFELDLFTNEYGIASEKLCLAPLFGTSSNDDGDQQMKDARSTSWSNRNDFCFVGGFRHDPNVDAVRQIHRLWTRIQAGVGGDVKMHVYGAHCPMAVQRELHDPSMGFHVHGYHPSIATILRDKRVLLAPIRFGAGIKGKVVDAWKHGLPVVGTPIASEGLMDNSGDWGGKIATNDDDFVDMAIELYENESIWSQCQAKGFDLVRQLCDESVSKHVVDRLMTAYNHREERRSRDYMRAICWHETMRSTQYFSKYLELKSSVGSKRG